MIYVVADDKIPDNYQSDNDDNSQSRDDDHGTHPMVSSASPGKATAHPLMQATAGDEHSPIGNPFMGELPVRAGHYTNPMMHSDLNASQHHFVENGGIGVGGQAPLQPSMQDMVPSPHDSSRRASLYTTTPSEYGSPASNVVFSQQWQQPVTTAPSSTPLYAFTPQQQGGPGQGPFVPQPGVAVPSGQQYISNHFHDGGLPGRGFDPNVQSHGSIFRPGSVPGVPHPQGVPHHSAYSQHYLGHDGRSLHQGSHLKPEPMDRGSLHWGQTAHSSLAGLGTDDEGGGMDAEAQKQTDMARRNQQHGSQGRDGNTNHE